MSVCFRNPSNRPIGGSLNGHRRALLDGSETADGEPGMRNAVQHRFGPFTLGLTEKCESVPAPQAYGEETFRCTVRPT